MTDVHITLQDIIDAIELGAFDREPNANILILGAFARRGKGTRLLSHEVPPPPKEPSTPEDVAPFLAAADAWMDTVAGGGFGAQIINRFGIELHGRLQDTRDRFATEIEADEEQRKRFVVVAKRLLCEVFKIDEVDIK